MLKLELEVKLEGSTFFLAAGLFLGARGGDGLLLGTTITYSFNGML